MKLDRTTYEAWLLDRVEGNLTPAQERELDGFFAANPDLGAEMSGLPMIDAVMSDPIDWKNELKKRLPPTGMPDAARLNEFLVARLEGDLDKTQELALDKFLFEHPENEQGAKRMAASKTAAEQFPFEHKPTIERHFPPQGTPDFHRLTDFLIAAREGDLSPEQERALTAFLAAHPETRRDEQLVAAAKVPTERIVFTGKAGLKRREVRVIALWHRYAVAASIALLLGFTWWVMRVEKNDGPAVAQEEMVKPVLPAKEAMPSPEVETPNEQGPQREGTAGSRGGDPAGKKGPQGPEAETLRENEAETLRKNMTPDAPAPEPQLVEDPILVQPEPAPVLAQDPAPTPKGEDPGTPVEQPVAASISRSSQGGTPIGTALANTVRNGVLESRDRDKGLDGDDVMALANKALGTLTGGHGHVDVRPEGGRDKWKVRLGKNLAISASNGR